MTIRKRLLPYGSACTAGGEGLAIKVLGVAASPRGPERQSLKLVDAVLQGAKARGAETESVVLGVLKMEFCNACGVCHAKGRCVKKDDFPALYEKITAADGLVMGSPNYFCSVTAQMKMLIDRMSLAAHCQLFKDKYTVSAATSGGIGRYRQVLAYLDRIMLNFGSLVTGGTGVSLRQGPKAFEKARQRAFRLGEALAEDIRAKKAYPAQERIRRENRDYFKELVAMHKGDWQYEYDYWQRAGC